MVFLIFVILIIYVTFTPYGDEIREKYEEVYNSSTRSLPDKNSVACYIMQNHHLPDYYITKEKARKAGWRGGQDKLEELFPGKAVAAEHEYRGRTAMLLPKANYYECDIGTIGQRTRGAKRLVYTEGCVSSGRYFRSGSYFGYIGSCRIYYTEDHYKTFVELDLSKCPANQNASENSYSTALERVPDFDSLF